MQFIEFEWRCAQRFGDLEALKVMQTASKMDWKEYGIPSRWVCYGHLWPKTLEAEPVPPSGEASSVSFR